jgi:hypothetical protein
MDIYINEQPADISLDTEKNIGEVISGIERWLSSSGSRIRKICLDNKDISVEALGSAFNISINDIGKLDIFVDPWREFAAEALEVLYEACMLYEKSAFDERKKTSAEWEKSPSARFLASDIPDIFNLATRTLSGEGMSTADFTAFIKERLRELANPVEELDKSTAGIELITRRLEELPLDMQTGKDQRAAETIQLFSGMGEKLFRLFFIYKSEGFCPVDFTIDGLSAKIFLEDFSSTLKELSTAYENKDTVLVGDIAEYELAPGLMKLFSAMKTIGKTGAAIQTAP